MIDNVLIWSPVVVVAYHRLSSCPSTILPLILQSNISLHFLLSPCLKCTLRFSLKASQRPLLCSLCLADPEWASYTLGAFVCQSCSGLHRNIAHISKVKSILLDPWSSSEVEVREEDGKRRSGTVDSDDVCVLLGGGSSSASIHPCIPGLLENKTSHPSQFSAGLKGMSQQLADTTAALFICLRARVFVSQFVSNPETL